MQIKVYTIDLKLPRWLKRTMVLVVLPAILLVGIGAAVRAAVTFPVTVSTFAGGETLSSTKLNTNFGTLKDGLNQVQSSLVSTQSSLTSVQSSLASLQSQLSTGVGVKASSLAGTIKLVTQVHTKLWTVPGSASSAWSLSPSCDSTEAVVGGGCIADAADQWANVLITGSVPENDHWTCTVRNNEAAAVQMATEVVCGKIVIQ
ncbi:MAG TPA: hypothetical protein VF518_11755 [Polyangia bacterium]